MAGRIRQITGHWSEAIGASGEICSCAPGDALEPDSLAEQTRAWLPASSPCTIAGALDAQSKWSPAGPACNLESEAWWYRTEFTANQFADDQTWLCFDGLATIADVWLNGTLLFSSSNMFHEHEHRIDEFLQPVNRLLIRFAALDALLAEKRPRPRWRAPMVANQQLRWFRTTLLGRTPGWSPPAPAIGPWRQIRLEHRRRIAIDALQIRADLEGSEGALTLSCKLSALGSETEITSAELLLTRNGQTFSAALEAAGDPHLFTGRLVVPDVDPWWPHTHGSPALYGASIRISVQTAGVPAAEERIIIDIGSVGFRSIDLDTSSENFRLVVNGRVVFCRGACWTPTDPLSFSADESVYGEAFDQICAAGMNMVRVSGAMVYEECAFLDLCDRHGILLWQDFMFANMDYPHDDPAFAKSVEKEVSQQLAKLQGRPCLALLCGNSEVEQQAAMFGAHRNLWNSAFFDTDLPLMAAALLPATPYWPSSAHGGAFPHQCNAGSTSYYGVGAYLRPIDDVRRTDVRFASECLAFANVPDETTFRLLPDGLGSRVHRPGWKSRTPRDLGAGWDFDDVRDHYLQLLFRTDPVALRYSDHDRYLDLGRIATGEVMAEVFQEWRRKRSACGGGLVWFLRDLWPSAGWGVIDSSGLPKAAYYYLSRALQPVTVFLTDEGVNGLAVHLVNDRAATLKATLDIALYTHGEVLVVRSARDLCLPACDASEYSVVEWFDGFMDLSHAYRFGRPPADLIVATLNDCSGNHVAQAFHFPTGRPSLRESDIGIHAEARRLEGDTFALRIRTRRLAQSVSIRAAGFTPSDNYFHIPPHEERQLTMRRMAGTGALKGSVLALNSESGVRIDV